MGSSTIRAQDAAQGEEQVEGHTSPAVRESLRQALARRIAESRQQDAFRFDEAALAEHVLTQLMAPGESGLTGPEALEGLRVPELRLTFACAQGDARAVAVFEQRYVVALVGERLGRVRLAAHEVEEVRQKLREDLLVDRGSGPRILQYTGRGDLAGFVRVSAIRIALKLVQKRERAGTHADDELDRITTERDPELAFVKDAYRPAFSAAFREAVEHLEGRERLLLRQQLVDGLSIDALGTLYGVHRSTVARWLVTAREHLLQGTREAFAAKLAVPAQELESLFGVLHSRLDLSLRSVL